MPQWQSLRAAANATVTLPPLEVSPIHGQMTKNAWFAAAGVAISYLGEGRAIGPRVGDVPAFSRVPYVACGGAPKENPDRFLVVIAGDLPTAISAGKCGAIETALAGFAASGKQRAGQVCCARERHPDSRTQERGLAGACDLYWRRSGLLMSYSEK